MNPRTAWVQIIPRDPLVFRDGRPFSAFPGAKVRGFPYPMPQTLAGAVRGRIGEVRGYRPGEGRWDGLKREVAVHGPLLFDRKNGEAFIPAPLDAVFMKKEEQGNPRLFRLKPGALPEGILWNMPKGLAPLMGNLPEGKPEPMPSFWRWERYEQWLLERISSNKEIAPSELGIAGLPREYRAHVKIDSDTFTAEESMLFETEGLVFLHNPSEEKELSAARELGLLARVEAEDLPLDALSGFRPLGGERRLAAWVWNEAPPPVPEPPDQLFELIWQKKRARLILVTPAHFKHSRPYLPPMEPDHVFTLAGLRVKLVAAAVGRPITISGWDLLEESPKPSRRLVPAGSVYFVELLEEPDRRAIEQWVRELWLNPLPGQPEQDRRDGFGLAVVGCWSCAQMEEKCQSQTSKP